MRAYEDQMERYRRTQKYREYQEYLDSFKKSPGKSMRQSLDSKPQLISHSSTPNRSVSCGSDESANQLNLPLDAEDEQLQQDCQEAIRKAMVDLRRFKMKYNDVTTYCNTRLPDETLTRETMTAFVVTMEPALFIYTRPQAEFLLNRVYQKTAPTDALSLAEVCISAAMGCHYVGRRIPKRSIWEYFASACVLLDTVPVCETTYLRIMRLFFTMTLYSIIEKHLSACSFIRMSH
jgi:hypothetical protein